MRDIVYEQAVLKHQQKMLRILNEYSLEDSNNWTERDLLAIQRALQVFIESFINMARYLIKQKYALPVSQSREAIDELRTQGDLNTTQYLQLLNIMSFHRILFDDYLEIDKAAIKSFMIKKNYLMMETLLVQWKDELNLLR